VKGKRARHAGERRVAPSRSARSRRHWAAAGCFAFATASAACGNADPDDSNPAGACPSDLPTDADCPNDAAPSYGTVIASIVEQRCQGCHFPKNPFSSQVFGDYQQLFDARRTALSRIYGCLMPPAEATPLAPEERGALLKWFVCGAPNN
jgi:hypothetical protein